TGASKNSYLVAVSTGMLNIMTKQEAEAGLAHEIAYVAKSDMVTVTLSHGVVNTIVIFMSSHVGDVVDRAVFKTENGHGPAFFITSLVAQLVLGILASMIVMWFSRQREFRADAGGAALAGRQNMIAALERLRAGQPSHLPDELVAFGINSGAAKLFSSHPPLSERIERLRNAR